MIPIKVHKQASDPYWDKLEEGKKMSINERYNRFFLMLKRNRSLTGQPYIFNREIVIKSTDGFRR